MLNSPLGGRRGIGFGLGRSWQREAAGEDWWLAGGISSDLAEIVYQPKDATDENTSKVNLVNPGTHDAIFEGITSWDASYGWLIPGEGDAIQVGTITGASHFYSSDSFSIILKFTPITFSSSAYGAILGLYNLFGFVFDIDNSRQRYYFGGSNQFINSTEPEVICINGPDIYYDGLLKESSAQSWASNINSSNLHLGFYQYIASTTNLRVQAFAYYNNLLTAAQVAAVSSEVLTI